MKSGRKGNRFLSRRSIEENGVPARASSFPRAKKNARETFVERNSRALFEVVGRRGLEPRTNCLKGNCSTIELASRPKLFAETKSEGENVFFPHGKQAFFFLPGTEIFRERSRGDKNAPAGIRRGSVFSFSPKRKTTRRKSESATAPSARAGTSSAGKPSRRRRSALRSARRCSRRRARADPSSLPRRGRESNNNSA